MTPLDTQYECEKSIARAGRAYRYESGTLDDRDAEDIIYDCQPIAGWYPLETFSEESVMERLRDEYEETAQLESLVHSACRRVWSKWNSTGHSAYAAEDWAIKLAKRYAEEDGIALVEKEPC